MDCLNKRLLFLHLEVWAFSFSINIKFKLCDIRVDVRNLETFQITQYECESYYFIISLFIT
jgi:hypothetical protein